MKKIIISIFSIGAVIAGVLYFGPTFTAVANPSQFLTASTASATTTLSYLTPGTGTTTLVMDTQSDGVNPADSLSLLIQYNASSSIGNNNTKVINWNYAYSQDNVNYYDENEFTNINATTSQLTGTTKVYNWAQYATSTSFSFDGNSTSSMAFKMVTLPIPTRYVRVTFSVPVSTPFASTTNAGIWAQFVAKKQYR